MKIRWAKQEELTGIVRDFSKMIAHNSQLLIENVRTEYRVLRVGKEVFFPVTINHTEWENSFVCAPYAAYTAYAKEEIKWNINHKTVRAILILLVNAISGWLKRGMLNKNVHVNNFLMTTNPYPEWNGKEIAEITSFIKTQYPQHAIIFRSLNDYQHRHLLQLFQKNKYENVGSRQVYIFDLTKKAWLKHRNNKHDNKLIEKKGLHFINHQEMKAYLPQALELYRDLYLKKYSVLNPQLTLKYFKEVHQTGIINFHGYIDKNKILKAFSGQFTLDKTITSPIVGYDVSAPQKEGLYIHAAQLALLNKFDQGLLLNLSSGAPSFKRMRGGQASIEYSAIYLKHLPLKRRLPWKVLQFISNKIGVPLIKKYKL
ncbi:hypothetical protein K8354_05165 [Polaribacter litorisediminis]|uniref:hypothetical protein n=1 Tax=Polaribacter litorisediminis TaxID=1908341 RepID=UPI001CBCE0B9|nr:hypothetical protein [Polaribacter litorisediminis]UAM99214.1 hypothetical protein K8354_05165 [Polaribacter litorisediminis]